MFSLKKKNKSKDGFEEDQESMGFFDHLEELRKRIIYSLLALIAGSIFSAFYINFIIENVLIKPAVTNNLVLQNLKPFGQPILYFKIIFVLGFIISFPFILYQIWKFIAPGLYVNERKWVRSITFFTSLCFFSGVLFSYYVMIPSMMSFASAFGTKQIQNNIDINEFFSFFSMMLLATGLVFEMPMVSWVLAKFGILSSGTLRKYRKHSIVVILIISAIVTPTPDPISQLIFASPLFVLYEISIIIAKLTEKKEIEKNEEN
jgi:sec-independent protein translocase protein TatC